MGLPRDPFDLELPDSRHHPGRQPRLAPATPAADSGHAALTDVLAGIAPADAATYARSLLAKFGSLGQVLAASPEAHLRVTGDEAVARQLGATRAALAEVLRLAPEREPLTAAGAELVRHLWASLAHREVECVLVVFLDARGCWLAEEEVARGGTRRAELEPRVIVRRALDLQAAALVVAHNHPSGDPRPSPADRAATDALVAAARLFDIRVHDHLILARSGWSSLRALGWLET